MNASHAHHQDDFVTAEVLRAAVQADAPHLVMREVLGEGGMAIVFAATHLSLNLPVAVKVLRAHGPHAAQMAERLLLEARVCAALTEAGAPRVLDARVLHDGTPYVVMERIAGNLLSEMLETGPLDPGLALEVTDGLLATLSAVHAAGVVHRDVKPANIILEARANGGFRVRLIDFGVAQLADVPTGPYGVGETNATQTGTVVGTPDYVAPEQLLGRVADGRADVYAVGATLFHMLTGTPPFSRPTMQLAIAATLQDPLPQLTALCPHLPLALERVLSAALSRELEARTPSADAMRSALRGVAPGLRSQRVAQLNTPPHGHAPLAHTPAPAQVTPQPVQVQSQPLLAQPVHTQQGYPQPTPALAPSSVHVHIPPVVQPVPAAARVELVLQTAPAPAPAVVAAPSVPAPALQYAETVPAAPAHFAGASHTLKPVSERRSARRGLSLDLEDGGDSASDFDDMDVLYPHRKKQRTGGALLLLALVSGVVGVLWLERHDPARLPPEVLAGIAQARGTARAVYARFVNESEPLQPVAPAGQAPTSAPAAVSAQPTDPSEQPSPTAPLAAAPEGDPAEVPAVTLPSTGAAPAPEAPLLAPEPAAAPQEPPAAPAPAPAVPAPVAAVPAPAAPAAPPPAAAAPAASALPPAPTPADVAPSVSAESARKQPRRARRGATIAPPDAPIVGEGYPLDSVINGIDAHLQGRRLSPPAPESPPEKPPAGVSENPY